jgi:enoyl-CoA hydratase/carnithine racemase
MEINTLFILVGTVVNFAVARIWYGFLFKRPWRQLTGRTPDEMPNRNQMMVAIALAIVMAIGVNLVAVSMRVVSLSSALIAALEVGVLLVAAVIAGEWLWDRKPGRLIGINIGFYIAYFGAMFVLFSLLG